MKKWLCILLALCMLPIAALATDFSQYSDEELKALYEEIKQECLDRNVFKSAVLEEGEYQAGLQIPAGEYYIVLNESYNTGWSPTWGIWSHSGDATGRYGYTNSTKQYFYIQDGEKLRITESSVIIEMSSGVNWQ